MEYRTVRIPFLSSDHAKIAKDVIGVDRELQAHAVKREMIVEDDELVVYVFFTLPPHAKRLVSYKFLMSDHITMNQDL